MNLKILLLFVFVITLIPITSNEISAAKPPNEFRAYLIPENQILNSTQIASGDWDDSNAVGTATFYLDYDMSELHYELILNVDNVVGIHIHNGDRHENNHQHLFDIKVTDTSNPETFTSNDTISGVITEDAVCKHLGGIHHADENYSSTKCMHHLIDQFLNHRAYINVHTDDRNAGGNAELNEGPGDLISPGEIRGQIYPVPSRLFESSLSADQQVFGGGGAPTAWDNVIATGNAKFVLNHDLNVLRYTITLNDIQNVVGIHIHEGLVNENAHFHLVDIIPTNLTKPLDFHAHNSTLTGVIRTQDVCPSGHSHGGISSSDPSCTLNRLLDSMRSHQAYIQVHTDDDGSTSTNDGPGDLYTPGEIRGHIYPAVECPDCILNQENQILTIYKFETAANPFLAETVTFLVSPNPYSHNVGVDFVDPQMFGANLIIEDNSPLDYDPMNGVIELVGVNPGVYSVTELKGPAGFLKNDEPYASMEVKSNLANTVPVTNIFLNVTEITGATEFEAPIFTDDVIDDLMNLEAQINGILLTSTDQMPPAHMGHGDHIFDGAPPPHIAFQMQVNHTALTPDELFSTLNIPTYDAPSASISAEGIAFAPPLFTAPSTDDADIITTPVLDEVNPGTEIVMRMDGTGIETDNGAALRGISFPLDIGGNNVAISAVIEDDVPDGFSFPSLSGGQQVGVFISVEATGDIDISSESTFSSNPTMEFTLAKISGSCPTGVQVFLYNDQNDTWNVLDPGPVLVSSSGPNDTCIYEQSVNHFSSYAVGTGFADTSGFGTTSVGGGDGGHCHACHDHGTGVSSMGSFDGTSGPNSDDKTQLEIIEEGGVVIGGRIYTIEDGVFTFGDPDDSILRFGEKSEDKDEFRFGDRTHYATITTFSEDSVINNFDFGNHFDGIRMLVEVEDNKMPVKYSMDGEIKRIQVHKESKSVTFQLDDVFESELLLRIPRTLVDAEGDGFIVLISASPLRQVDYEISESNDEFVIFKVDMPNHAETLTIIGTQVVPEFEWIALQVILVSSVAIIILAQRYTKISRLSFGNV